MWRRPLFGMSLKSISNCQWKSNEPVALEDESETGGRSALSPSLDASARPPLLLLCPGFRHSPGRLMQSEAKAMAHNLPAREHFGEDVSRHVIGWAVHHVDGPARNNLSDEMETNVDVFCPRVIVVVRCEFECCLVIAEQRRLALQ